MSSFANPSLRGTATTLATAAAASTTLHGFDYDYLVIGGGSGGVSSAKRAAQLYGKKVCIVEATASAWGGTCVNVGCVPKKILFMASHVRQAVLDAPRFALLNTGVGATTTTTTTEDAPLQMDWKVMKSKRDAYIKRLNQIYRNGLLSAGDVTVEDGGWASFVDRHTINIRFADGSNKTVTALYICIATGGKPMVPAKADGSDGIAEHSITSDGFFELDEQPEKVVVVGAGYIAVELAGVFHGLGVQDTHLVVRKSKALRNFDDEISSFLDTCMVNDGIHMHRNTGGVAKIELQENGKKTVTTISGEVIDNVDVVLMAPGRVANIDGLQLDKANVQTTTSGDAYIVVDDYQQTNIDNIMAVGDVCGKVELTPMAIAAGRRLADRLFGNYTSSDDTMPKTSYENVPTVVFSHPPIGTIGLTEAQAVAKYGADNIKVYRSTFVNLYYSMFDDVMAPNEKPKTLVKLICAGLQQELVVGLHIIGMAADEMLQGFGVAIKMGATKADFDACIAIHPTAAEEVVTLGVWGTSPLVSGARTSPLMGAPAAEAQLSKM
jgi:glutathione reductase (NADPH)